jgi:hypothetical protein
VFFDIACPGQVVFLDITCVLDSPSLKDWPGGMENRKLL